MFDALDIKRYRNYAGETFEAVRLTENNFKSIQRLLGGDTWRSGNAHSFTVGLTFGEYEDTMCVPFGWWLVMANGVVDYLADVAFANEFAQEV